MISKAKLKDKKVQTSPKLMKSSRESEDPKLSTVKRKDVAVGCDETSIIAGSTKTNKMPSTVDGAVSDWCCSFCAVHEGSDQMKRSTNLEKFSRKSISKNYYFLTMNSGLHNGEIQNRYDQYLIRYHQF